MAVLLPPAARFEAVEWQWGGIGSEYRQEESIAKTCVSFGTVRWRGAARRATPLRIIYRTDDGPTALPRVALCTYREALSCRFRADVSFGAREYFSVRISERPSGH